MPIPAVVEVLVELERVGVQAWVDGGWGVDALVGRQTRQHGDLDLALDRNQLSMAVAALEALGYRRDIHAVPGEPSRLVFVASDDREVDLHPLRFDQSGDGWQQHDADRKVWGKYPARDLLGLGSIGGHKVSCLSKELQMAFHQGYERRPADEHDLRLLGELP
jgi:lincosamide nucleotidyltransferase A/C/D/E